MTTGQKQITIHLTDDQVKTFNSQGLKLCFAAALGSQREFNMVAWSGTASASVLIQWQDNYKIAATRSAHEPGKRFDTDTDATNIRFQNVYTLYQDWSGKVSTNDGVQRNSFRFDNNTEHSASAVVFKVIKGKQTPFYISNPAVDTKGTQVLTPTSDVGLWVQQDVEDRTMISPNTAGITSFDMSGETNLDVEWDDQRFIKKV